MLQQQAHNPARGAGSRRTVKTPKRNTPAPEARTRKTETLEKVENMAKEPEQKTPLTITLPEFVRYELRTGLAETFAAMQKENAETFAAIHKENAETFAAMHKENAERYGKVETSIAERFGNMETRLGDKIHSIIKWLLGTGIVIILFLIQLIADWPLSFSPEPAPAPAPAVQYVPAPAPAADPPASLPLDAE